MNSMESIALNPLFDTVQRMTFSQRLQYALDLRGRDGASLIQALGVSKGTIYNILNDITTPEKIWGLTAVAICRELGISIDWFLKEAGPVDAAKPSTEADEREWPAVMGYAQAVGLGAGAEAQEYAETHKLKFRADSLARKHLRPDGLAVMYGAGDSMLPRIRPGDAVLFDTKDAAPKDGAIFVVMWKGEIYAKRAMVLDDATYFAADNPAGDHHWRKPKRMDAKRDPVQILGRVRWIGSWED